MGASVTQYIHLGSKELTLNAEYYRTEFEKQMVTDLDYNIRDMYAYFSTGRSYANNFQIEAKTSPARGWEVTAAWRWNDNELYTGGKLQRRALTSRYKAMAAVSYQTPLKTWQFDVNAQFNGGGRVPTTLGNPEGMTRQNTFGSYQMYNAQITKWFRRWSIYAGCENIGTSCKKTL